MKLFVIILRYLVDKNEINLYRDSHIEHLLKFYESGNLLLSGPQTTGTGGVILARGKDREEVESIIFLDPFYSNKLAEFQIFEFTPARYSASMEFLVKYSHLD